MHILFIEDDAMLGQATTEGLRDHFCVDWFTTAEEAKAAIATSLYDLIILDRGLPDGSGLHILKDIRHAKNDTPVMFLTAKDSIERKVEGFNAGADDYVIKPFDLDELIARCSALIRRAQGRSSSLITWNDIIYDPQARAITHSGIPITLSAREYAIFEILITHIGHIISKSQLEERIYDWEQEIESNTIEVHISGLRRKLGKDIINTIRGIGYCIPKPS